MMKLLALLLKAAHQILFLQEQIRMDLATLTNKADENAAKVATLGTAVQVLVEQHANKPAVVLQSDLDEIGVKIDAANAAVDDATAKIQAVTAAG